jgi:hypothetical protein
MRYVSRNLVALITATTALLVVPISAQNILSDSVSPQRRPAGVPSGYAITPFGYFHPSCIQKLAKGERLLASGHVERSDGALAENVASCSYMHYTAAGVPVSAAAVKPFSNMVNPEVDGWIADAEVTTGSAGKSYGGLLATWTVPRHPKNDDGQVLYFFPGLEDINSAASILQPVMQWYHHQWAIASWNCCLDNIVTESPVVNVNPGDLIYGSITSNCPASTVSCSTWNVLTLDMSTGQSTTLSGTPSDGQVFNWAFGGAMEPYFVNSCSDYPPDRKIIFENVTVFNEALKPIKHPNWSDVADATQTPQCGYEVKTKDDMVTITY